MSMSHFMRALIIVLSSAVSVHGYGGRSGLCNVGNNVTGTSQLNTMMAGRGQASGANSQFTISINPTQIVAGGSHTVTLARKNGQGSGGFNGLLLYIEDTTGLRIGTFTTTSATQTLPTASNIPTPMGSCPTTAEYANTLTHTSGAAFTASQAFTWTAPPTVAGPTKIYAIAYDNQPTPRLFNIPTALDVTVMPPSTSPTTMAPSTGPTTMPPSKIPSFGPSTTPTTTAPSTTPPTSGPSATPTTAAPSKTPTAMPISSATAGAKEAASACTSTMTNLGPGAFGIKAVVVRNDTYGAVRMSGPSAMWIGLGFGTAMTNSDAIIYTTALDYYKLGAMTRLADVVKQSTNPFTVLSESSAAGTRTICVLFSATQFASVTGLSFTSASVNVIYAVGVDATLTANGHATNRGKRSLTVANVGTPTSGVRGVGPGIVSFVCLLAWFL